MPFLIFFFRIWSRRMFIWSQCCAWSLGFRRKVATASSFLVAKPRVPVAKCDYAPGFFEPCMRKLRTTSQGLCPDLYAVLQNCYRTPSRLFVSGGEEILLCEGTTPGDLLSMSFYALATLPLARQSQEQLPSLRQISLADESAGAGHLEALRQGWDKICVVGAQ